MSRERRAFPRFPLVLSVKYTDAESVFDYTENLSGSGLLIRTERTFSPGERTSLVLSFPQLLEPVELTVEVVRSTPGQGDQPGGVAVRIPDDLPDHRARLAEVTRFVASASRRPAPTCSILLCEDNGLVANMYAAALRRMAETDKLEGMAVEVVNDGGAAWDRLLRTPSIDMLITDVFMPAVSGTELVDRIRAEPRLAHLPVVVITSGGEREREELAALGVTLFLHKPIKYLDLADTVRFLLKARQGRVTTPPRAAVVSPVEPNPRSLVDLEEAPARPGGPKPTARS
jgi:CheY-like chemotaxis protein/Tfp pilus assembly protein PilZ